MKRPRPTKRKLASRLGDIETDVQCDDPLQSYLSSEMMCHKHGLKEVFERQGFEVTIADDYGEAQRLETYPPFGEATRPLAWWDDDSPTTDPYSTTVIWDDQERPDEALTVSTYEDCEVVVHEDAAIMNPIMSRGEAEREGRQILDDVIEPVYGTSGQSNVDLVEVAPR